MVLALIPLDHALPAVQAYLAGQRGPLGDDELRRAAELLERAVRCGELLAAYAVAVAGRPSRQ